MVGKEVLQLQLLKKLQERYTTITSQIASARRRVTVYPEEHQVLGAFKYLPKLQDVKVVIQGQDPYHGPGQAHGLCFSVTKEVPPPPSLVNIFKELEQDLNIPIPAHGCLEKWAEQKVLLLNRILTVEEGKPLSHEGGGWEEFTEDVIKYIDQFSNNVVFILWGRQAQKIEQLIKNPSHLILKASHPSPLSANKGFFGCKHFSKTNEFLTSVGKDPIDWRI